MTLDKEDIATAKEMAQTLQKSRNSKLIVVGNLLSHLLAERVTPQRTAAVGEDTQRAWVGLTDEDIDEWTPEIHAAIRAIEAKLKAKNERKEKNT